MKIRNLALSLLCLLILAPGKLSAKNAEPVKIYRDLQYTAGEVNPFQCLDLYLPAQAASPPPLVIWIHGGAWLMGDKNHPPADLLLKHGFAVASINYRLAQQAVFPAQIQDCKAAVRWLRAHAKEYGFDPRRIAVWGHSAGGHLAALLAVSNDEKSFEGNGGNANISSRIQAAVNWAGLSDLVSVAEQAPPNCQIDFKSSSSPVLALLGPGKNKEAYLKASPVTYISKDDPPILVVYGDKDDVVPPAQSEEFCRILKVKGATFASCVISGGGHSLGQKAAFSKTLEFLKTYLQGR
ncbi:MAG: alpha/beta hydrolase [Candidatus Obscuribacterales bacterium]|nr:alpha/beta hydrolase [Candidatus Obscuribacterales bacterium]